ncbi:hypothetical protein AMAG_06533 [Allomyces macrogynus ATCC 38327]|uniref:RRM domain-containing protein n=1 Tax=Allomyces macrogynus (strain ATCC 38327) TaxID=578462 RepID=A0A0L0SGU4_ALLM3|nr:hypothetical protein AMAG_06533 [Allomyces macrogynus ATCC 38327]|eukprot:KNE61731.1 hypothetical protein AMAG_06533 [Allomyces macrogynus ATCC 38327]
MNGANAPPPSATGCNEMTLHLRLRISDRGITLDPPQLELPLSSAAAAAPVPAAQPAPMTPTSPPTVPGGAAAAVAAHAQSSPILALQSVMNMLTNAANGAFYRPEPVPAPVPQRSREYVAPAPPPRSREYDAPAPPPRSREYVAPAPLPRSREYDAPAPLPRSREYDAPPRQREYDAPSHSRTYEYGEYASSRMQMDEPAPPLPTRECDASLSREYNAPAQSRLRESDAPAPARSNRYDAPAPPPPPPATSRCARSPSASTVGTHRRAMTPSPRPHDDATVRVDHAPRTEQQRDTHADRPVDTDFTARTDHQRDTYADHERDTRTVLHARDMHTDRERDLHADRTRDPHPELQRDTHADHPRDTQADDRCDTHTDHLRDKHAPDRAAPASRTPVAAAAPATPARVPAAPLLAPPPPRGRSISTRRSTPSPASRAGRASSCGSSRETRSQSRSRVPAAPPTAANPANATASGALLHIDRYIPAHRDQGLRSRSRTRSTGSRSRSRGRSRSRHSAHRDDDRGRSRGPKLQPARRASGTTGGGGGGGVGQQYDTHCNLVQFSNLPFRQPVSDLINMVRDHAGRVVSWRKLYKRVADEPPVTKYSYAGVVLIVMATETGFEDALQMHGTYFGGRPLTIHKGRTRHDLSVSPVRGKRVTPGLSFLTPSTRRRRARSLTDSPSPPRAQKRYRQDYITWTGGTNGYGTGFPPASDLYEEEEEDGGYRREGSSARREQGEW